MAELSKVVLLTGAASGIGAAALRSLVAAGHRVAAADVNFAGVSALAAELGPAVLPLALDVRDAEAWQTALDATRQQFGRLDVLINNAAVNYTGRTERLDLASLTEMLDVNLIGPLTGLHLALPRLAAAGGGQVINVASLVSFVPLTGQVVYSASKHALRALHTGLALEWRGRGVHFTLLCPPAVDTPMLHRQIEDDDTAVAFLAPPVPAEAVAAQLLRAVDEAPAEIIMGGPGGQLLKHLGVEAALLGRLLGPLEALGRRRQQRLRAG